MDRSPYTPMAPTAEAPNPLRPYYRPPSIGFTELNSHGGGSGGTPPNGSTATAQSPGSASSKMFQDINIDGMFGNGSTGSVGGGPSTFESLRALTDAMMWKYSSVFMAQPFEVAKMVLQTRCTPGGDRPTTSSPSRSRRSGALGARDQFAARRRGSHRSDERFPGGSDDGRIPFVDSEEEDEEGDESNYFTSAAPQQAQRDRRSMTPGSQSGSISGRGSVRGERARPRQQDDFHTSGGALPTKYLALRRPDSLTEVLGQLWTREGAWGVWKGTNVSFLHSVLLKTLETWTRSALCAMVDLPDPGVVVAAGGLGGLDILDSPSPLASLAIAVAAAGLAGIVLAPLDAVRTRIMLTTTSSSPRSILHCLKALPSWIIPSLLFAPTLLHAAIPTIISTSTPLLLRTYFRIDPIISPTSFNVCTFCSSVVELFIKLPFETVLRRAQIAFVSQSPQRSLTAGTLRKQKARRKNSVFDDYDESSQPLETVIHVGPYSGVIATMWRISREEGSLIAAAPKTSGATWSKAPTSGATRGSQGIEGLWRGWRVGFWALAGVWATSALGTGRTSGAEF